MKKIYLLLMLSLGALIGFGQATGDIAFVGFNVDDDEDFAIVTLADIPENTVIYFTDNEANGFDISSGEGTFEWNSGSAIISAGTVVVFSDVASSTALTSSIGTLTDGTGTFALSQNGDGIVAYLGIDESTPTTFLAGIQNEIGNEGNLVGSGLILGATFITITSESTGSPDGGNYIGSRNTQATFSGYINLISDSGNWETETSTGGASLPFPTTSFSLAEIQSVGFTETATNVSETNTSFELLIPVALVNYGGSQVDLMVEVTGGSAEGSDYTLNSSLLTFTENGTINVSININDDADDDAETIEITLIETTSTSISINPSTYTININDDDTAPLVITEIMYNPSSILGSDNDYEYVEIFNAGDNIINLEGYTLSNAFESSFSTGNQIASGEYILVTINALSYPSTGGQIFEWTSGGLQNGGETVVLKNASGAIVDEVAYNPSLIEAADGDGSSLSLFDITADNRDMTYWIGSGKENGTPGTANDDITVWVATLSTEADNAGNWSNGVPSTGLSAAVLSGGSNPVISSDIVAASFKIGTGISLSVTSGSLSTEDELILDGDVSVGSGSALAILGESSGEGTLTVIRNTTGNGGYSILGAPVGGVLLADISANYLYGYDEPNATFTAPSVTEMAAGSGFFVGFNAASPAVSFTGSAISGTVTKAISFDGDGFNLVANPYAAAISTTSFLAANSTDTDGTIYLWDDGGTNEGVVRGGDYITVNDMGSLSVGIENRAGTGQAGTGPAGNGFIASTQGFFVNANDAGDVTFTSDMQVNTAGANADANHYRKAGDKQLVRLSISGNGLYNELLIGFVENATLGRDHGLDALKFSGNELISFYSMQENNKYAIQALPKLNSEVTAVQLGIDLAEAGEYKLNLNEIEGISDDMNITLIDNKTGTIYDLLDKKEVSFSNSGSLVNSKRFELVLSPKAVLGIDTSNLSSKLTVFSNEQGLNIQTLDAFQNADVKVCSLSGSVVLSSENADFSQKIWSTAFDSKGVFVLTIQTKDGTMVQKFLN